MKHRLGNISTVVRSQGQSVIDNISSSRYIPHVQLFGGSGPIISTRYLSKQGILFQADCLDLLANIRSGSVDMVFADPPFNLGKRYEDPGVTDQHLEEAYRGWCRTWLLESIRVLKPGGSVFVYHWPKWLMDFGAWLNNVPQIEFRNWIALKMKAGFPIKGRVHPAHYGLLYFVKKGHRPTFNVVRVKSPTCKNCGTLQRDYGGYREKYREFEEDGVPWVQVSDFWEDTRPAIFDKARASRINELPIHVPERAILMATNPGDVVLDVFSGSGSTLHAAQRNDRLWIAGDYSDSTPALRRIATIWGTEESAKVPKKLAVCFNKKFREILPNYVPPAQRPITKVEKIDSFVEKDQRDAARSKIIKPKAKSSSG